MNQIATIDVNTELQPLEAEQAAQKAIDDARKAKKTHQTKIQNAAKTSLIREGISTDTATQIVGLIRDGKIANVEIVY